jgi:D-aminopeptidase
MKILIAADMEGVTGVVISDHVTPTRNMIGFAAS